MQINLNPDRGHAEPFKIYQSRRKANGMRVKRYLNGQWIWGGNSGTIGGTRVGPLRNLRNLRQLQRRMF